MKLWSVVLAGGIGSRFWPLSTPSLPKQLLPLVDSTPLLAGTLARLAPAVPVDRTLVLTNRELVRPILDTIPGLSADNIIAEPKPAGTAAALAWAALEIERRDGADAVMICVHADWFIKNDEEFRRVLIQAASTANDHDSLVTVGIVPSRPDTGFGYIQPGDPVEGTGGAHRVARFVEKPDRANAARMCAEGYLWNSGIFVWRASRFLQEIRDHTPEVAASLNETDITHFFASVKPVSVDVGVMERSNRVMVLPGDFGWDDIGTWSALGRVLPRDADGNAVRGSAAMVSSRNNIVWSPEANAVLYGVDDLVVVNSKGTTLVTRVELATDLKNMLEALPREMREK